VGEAKATARGASASLGIAVGGGAYYRLAVTTISLKLPEHLLELLEKESRARGASKSSLVRECLEKSLGSPKTPGQPNCYDLARDLAGSIKNLPRDLATNPKYMIDFGK
jgi:hypothetical protein